MTTRSTELPHKLSLRVREGEYRRLIELTRLQRRTLSDICRLLLEAALDARVDN